MDIAGSFFHCLVPGLPAAAFLQGSGPLGAAEVVGAADGVGLVAAASSFFLLLPSNAPAA